MWGISAGVCGTRSDVYVQVCGLCLDVCFFLFLCDGSGLHDPDCDWNRDSAAHLAKSARGLTCHCEWKPNILQPIHFGCLRERERRWDRRGGKEKERAEVSISLSIRLSACHFGQLCRHPVRSDSLSFELFWTGSPPTAAAAQETWMKQTRVKKRGWWGTLYSSCLEA